MSSAVCDAVTTVLASRLAPASASDVVDRRRTSSPAPVPSRDPTRSPPARPATAAPAATAGVLALRAVRATVGPAPLLRELDRARVFVAEMALVQDLADAFCLVAGALEVLRHALRRLAELLARLADRL